MLWISSGSGSVKLSSLANVEVIFLIHSEETYVPKQDLWQK